MTSLATAVVAQPATPPSSGNAAGQASRFGRLSALAPLGLDASACLHINKPWVECKECANACPALCLTLGDGTLSITATACLSCGRCARVCPTGALMVEGFSLQIESAGHTLTLGCPKQGEVPGDSIRVPCLGGLHENDLLSLLKKHPATAVRLTDDHACSTCSSGQGSETPARQLCAGIAPILRSSLGSTDRVTVWQHPSRLPNSNGQPLSAAPNRPEEPATSCRTSRRAFFSGLGRAVSNSVVKKTAALGFGAGLIDTTRLDKTPRRPIPYSRAADTRLLMRQLAATVGNGLTRPTSPTLPAAALLPGIAVSDRCQAHGVCARLCPTGALRLSPQGNTLQLSFDAWQCIDCGACELACPESALAFEAPAWRPFAEEVIVLSTLQTRECERCGEAFAGIDTSNDNSALCAHCSKSSALSQAGFALFHRAGSTQPAETGPP